MPQAVSSFCHWLGYRRVETNRGRRYGRVGGTIWGRHVGNYAIFSIDLTETTLQTNAARHSVKRIDNMNKE